jgi:hypothetical protein
VRYGVGIIKEETPFDVQIELLFMTDVTQTHAFECYNLHYIVLDCKRRQVVVTE